MDYESLKNKYVYTTDDVEDLFWSADYSKSELFKQFASSLRGLQPISLNPVLYGIEFYSTMSGTTCVFCHKDKSYLEKISDEIIDYFFNEVTDSDYDFDEFEKFLSKYDLKYFNSDGGDYYWIEYLITDKPLESIIKSLEDDYLPDYYELKRLGTIEKIPKGEEDWSGEDYSIFVIKRIEERF